MIIDSHCHLNMPEFANDIEEVVKNAKESDLEGMLTICTKLEELEEIKNLSNKFKLWYSGGIHPCNIKKNSRVNLEVIKNHANNSNFIGIGETGLDFYYNHSEKKDQIDSFLEHIDASKRLNLPLIVHTRSAERETLEILKKTSVNNDLKILIHCFTGTKEFAFKLLDLGAYISASGVVTFKKSKNLADTFKEIPMDKILVETDAPYLSPEPLRGKSNEPSHITHTVRFLSNLKNITYEDFSNATTKNFFKLFGKLN